MDTDSNSLDPQFKRLRDNCLKLGTAAGGTNWSFVASDKTKTHNSEAMCKVLFVLNTVGAGVGKTILWETAPPKLADTARPWQSEQASAAMHLERQLREINSMCATTQIAARLQVLTCEPIPAVWTNWMDSILVDCGGTPMSDRVLEDAINALNAGKLQQEEDKNRYSPLQIVVSSSPATADACHDMKSGFMEKRMQDLILAVPDASSDKSHPKMSHADLISSDDFDVYVGLRWSSLITVRSVYAFLQASVDLAAAASSQVEVDASLYPEFASMNGPFSPFLIPTFVRMSYVSEENNKVAKWRMHGDFFHPAAWEICRDSFDATWIPHSIAASDSTSETKITSSCLGLSNDDPSSCGQWWLYMAEEQMPTSPEVYANENTIPIVRGGSNAVFMLTERHRREIVSNLICKRNHGDSSKECGEEPQAIIPLGDMESFISNFMPNTALGKQHHKTRRPGYSRPYNTEENREALRKKKKLKEQEDIEKALFDYTVYPAALMHKDATLKAARARDASMSTNEDARKESENGSFGIPQKIKSVYYDVSITKPRDPVNGWCMSMARRGLCTLYSDYLRTISPSDKGERRCLEHCGLSRDWTPIDEAGAAIST